MYVIYDNFGLKMTTEENYKARIRDERKVTDLRCFESPEQAIDYFVTYYKDDKNNYRVEV